MFSENSSCQLFILGGNNSVKLHRQFITKHFGVGKDLRHLKKDEYNKACFDAIKNDMTDNTQVQNAAFYALIIETEG